MKLILILVIYLAAIFAAHAQEVVPLKFTANPEVTWPNAERQYYSDIWATEVVTNVSEPTLTVFRPEQEANTGTAVIIAPGGALFAHSINSEGYDVAKWLAARGITSFVLKYRLVPTGEDGVQEASLAMQEPEKYRLEERLTPVLPLSISDGLAAVDYVRTNASRWGIATDKIGFMGFSAGGTVTMGVTYNYTADNRPDFIVPVYAWTDVFGTKEVPDDAPPMLVVCASDDSLNLAPASIKLYSEWLAKGKVVGLHMYSQGGHGFGMRKLNLPSDSWIERFYDWAVVEKLVTPKVIAPAG
ncbi:MAG: alpha/beta hydrolase [Pseudomonadota bacterium]